MEEQEGMEGGGGKGRFEICREKKEKGNVRGWEAWEGG